MNWLGWLILGAFAGAWLGIAIMCALYLSKKCDEAEGGGP